jgi:hypothetical protein
MRADGSGYTWRKMLGYRISNDKGRTWSEHRELDYAGNTGGLLHDGTVILPSFMNEWVDETQLNMVVHWSADGGMTWKQKKGVPVRFPPERRLVRATGAYSALAECYFWGNVLPLDEKLAVGTMYGLLNDGKQSTPTGRWRSVLIRTADGGNSWEFMSVIAGDKPTSHAGYTEPSIVRLANDDLLCVMRTEYAEPRILAQCWSKDGGKTWSDPIPAPGIPGVTIEERERVKGKFDAGNVSPQLLLLENGVLVMVYGRPGLKVAFSFDGRGESWDRVETIVSAETLGTAMSALAPLGKDQLLIIHDVYKHAEKRRNAIFVRTLTVSGDRRQGRLQSFASG